RRGALDWRVLSFSPLWPPQVGALGIHPARRRGDRRSDQQLLLEDGSHGDPRAASSEEPLTDRDNLINGVIEGRADRAGVNAGHKEEKPEQTQGYMQEC